MFYIDGNSFLTINFKHIDLNYSSNSLLEILTIKYFLVYFLVDSVMWFCILLISIKMSYFSSLKLILINVRSSSFSIAICISIFFHLYQCDLFHQLLLLIYAWKDINHLGSLKFECCVVLFCLQMLLLFLLILVDIFLSWLLYHVN